MRNIVHFLLFCCLTFSAGTASAKVIYVDPATGQNFNNFDFGWGLSWSKPCKDLVHALYWAVAGDEIWLNTGTYYPCQPQDGLGTANANRSKSFYTWGNIKIYGGFSISAGATSMATRNPSLYVTTLSGEIQQDNNPTNNSYQILRTYLNNGFSVLDGVTVSGAYNAESVNSGAVYGGGMYIIGVSPIINNCKFVGNQATQGAGAFIENSNATFTGCLFQNNIAVFSGALFTYIPSKGGGLYVKGGAPTFTSCNFTSNHSIYNGTSSPSGVASAVYNDRSNASFTSCFFQNNNSTTNELPRCTVVDVGGSPTYAGCGFYNNTGIGLYSIEGSTDIIRSCELIGNIGGGIRVEAAGTKVYNCNILNNQATNGRGGGGIGFTNTKTQIPVVSNCLIAGNSATRGGGVEAYYTSAKFNNCTIANNTALSGQQGGGGVFVIGRGYTGLDFSSVLPASIISEPIEFSNCIVYGNTGSLGTFDSIKRNFYTVQVPAFVYVYPFGGIVPTYEYRPAVRNSIIGVTNLDSFNNNIAINAGSNLLNTDPRFVAPGAGNYNLNFCSPGVNSGSNAFVPPPANTIDLAGNPRFFETTVDRGCYELQVPFGGAVTNTNQSICQGQTAVIFGVPRTQAGVYTQSTPLPNGCTSIQQVTLSVNPLPKGIASNSDNCFNTGTISIKPTVGTAPFSIRLNGVTRNNITADSSASFPNLTAGTYKYYMTDANGCQDSAFATLTTNILNSSIVYVDSAATGNNTGSNWANAFTDLQSALQLASCSGVTQIWVARGTYYPSRDVSGTVTSSRFATFRMLNGITIYGGFNVPTGDTTLATRKWKTYATVLSGDIQKDGNPDNNVFNVVNNFGNGLNNTAVLDGFTITNANNSADFGGGITFGGGMTNNGSSPTVRNCIFSNNRVTGVQQAFGGAMYNINCTPVISNCQFLNNSVTASFLSLGGAIYNDNSGPVITNCTFIENTCNNAANRNGGGISCAAGPPMTISNCLFVGNFPGAVNLFNNSAVITHSSFYSNPGIATFAGAVNSAAGSNAVITNCILFGNSGNISNSSSVPVISHSLIGGSNGSGASWNAAFGTDGGGNIDANPRFTVDYRLTPCSPARNAGTNTGVATLDLDNNPRTVGGTTDMGCYEFQGDLSIYGTTVYVDANATGLNNGTSWANAFKDLSDALSITGCTAVNAIYVSKGTYYVSRNANDGLAEDYQAATFRLRPGVAVYGGFSVADGITTLAARNPWQYKTILSGDANKDGILENNVKAVVTATDGLNNTSVLDGFTIQDGYNNTTGTGSGIFIQLASPLIRNCIIQNNKTSMGTAGYGAGTYIYLGNPVFRNCRFYANNITGTSVAHGAGAYIAVSSPGFFDCEFRDNTLNSPNTAYGAAMHSSISTVTMVRCRIINNSISAYDAAAGGFYADGSNPCNISNCLFVNNTGGAIYTDNNALTLTNSTLVNNYNPVLAGGLVSIDCNPVVSNCIIYGNTPANIANLTGAVPVIRNSLVQGSGGSTAWNPAYGTDGGGNRDGNPLLTADYRLTPCSPAWNAGLNTYATEPLDLDSTTRIKYGTADMGCYESNYNLAVYGTRVYVNAAATGTKDGTSWANACNNLEDALNIARCTGVTEIYVSKGTYYPINDPNGIATNNQFSTFQMKNNLSIIGGFSVPDGAVTAAQRNPSLYVTTLSGDIQNDGIQSNNVYNVINNFNTGLDTTAILDGFTVSGAWNNITGLGGGVINSNTSPKFLNCIFKDNFAGGTPTARGGGMHNSNGAPILRNCHFINNSVSGINNAFGGGLSNDNSSLRISRCRFSSNTVSAPNPAGGGMYSNGGGGVIDNSLFSANVGGAICADGSVFSVFNSTIAGNFGNTIRPGGLFLINGSGWYLANSIIYGNTFGSVGNISTTPTFFYCDIEGSGTGGGWNNSYGINGGGNRDEDPQFTPDYRLSICSPLVNAADNGSTNGTTLDLDNTPRIKSALVDFGCYESLYSNVMVYGTRLYVNANNTNTVKDGNTWGTALTSLEDALTFSRAGCVAITEIYVSKGTYYPEKDAGGSPANNLFACFRMKNNLNILGGFSVADGVTSLSQRNPALYVTTLSGDIQQDNIAGNNVYNVINNFNTGLDTTAILDGFTVSGAWNNFTGLGGGVINSNSSPKFLNCMFRDNFAGGTATARGGGMHNISSSPILRNCTFFNNSASGINNAFGAGLSNDNSSPRISRCVFSYNTVNAPNPAGGGMYSNGGGGAIDNSILHNNNGTAICADGSVFTLYNVTITGNSGNPSRAGGLFLLNGSNFNIMNSIVYGNAGGSIVTLFTTPTFYYSNAEGCGAPGAWNNSFGINGGGNQDVNPIFTPDYQLANCSPLIDAGDNASIFGLLDAASKPRIVNNRVDMGAYERQTGGCTLCPGEAGYFFTSIPGTTYQWQVNNGSGYVNISNGGIYSGANSPTLLLTGAPTSMRGHRYRCVVDGAAVSPEQELKFVVKWNGSISTAWENPGNWDCGVLPDAFTDVIVPPAANNPAVNATASCFSLQLLAGSTVVVASGVQLYITGK